MYYEGRGKSVHNQRIERCLRDMWNGFTNIYHNLFNFMKNQGILNPDDDMAESNFRPVLFTGSQDQDARTWLNTLNDYIAYKGVADDKSLELFNLRLSGHAHDWLVTVPDAQKDTF